MDGLDGILVVLGLGLVPVLGLGSSSDLLCELYVALVGLVGWLPRFARSRLRSLLIRSLARYSFSYLRWKM